MTRFRLGSLVLICTAPSFQVCAHHSFAEYDQDRTIELAGMLTEVRWTNPHVHFTLRTTDRSTRVQTWELESNSVSILRRTNATPQNLKVADQVKIAGWPSKRTADRMFVTNVLQTNGQELVLDSRAKPRWASVALGLKTSWVGGATSAAPSLFHVWASDLGNPAMVFPWKAPSQYPLTDKAKRAVAAWNPIRDTVARGCDPKGMPTIIEQPYPIEFVDQHDTILMRMEEYDTVRVVHMGARAPAESQPKSRLGYSIGHWEGKSLVVDTSRINWRYFDSAGVPQGNAMTISEHFTPSADGSRLDYTMRVTDPEIFTKPLELQRMWVNRPGEEVKPYNCTAPRDPSARSRQ
jgi:hypothetical protein